MRLYDIPNESKIKVATYRNPSGELFTFHHVDGMYSSCTLDVDGKHLHLSANTPLELEGKFYTIKPNA